MISFSLLFLSFSTLECPFYRIYNSLSAFRWPTHIHLVSFLLLTCSKVTLLSKSSHLRLVVVGTFLIHATSIATHAGVPGQYWSSAMAKDKNSPNWLDKSEFKRNQGLFLLFEAIFGFLQVRGRRVFLIKSLHYFS